MANLTDFFEEKVGVITGVTGDSLPEDITGTLLVGYVEDGSWPEASGNVLIENDGNGNIVQTFRGNSSYFRKSQEETPVGIGGTVFFSDFDSQSADVVVGSGINDGFDDYYGETVFKYDGVSGIILNDGKTNGNVPVYPYSDTAATKQEWEIKVDVTGVVGETAHNPSSFYSNSQVGGWFDTNSFLVVLIDDNGDCRVSTLFNTASSGYVTRYTDVIIANVFTLKAVFDNINQTVLAYYSIDDGVTWVEIEDVLHGDSSVLSTPGFEYQLGSGTFTGSNPVIDYMRIVFEDAASITTTLTGIESFITTGVDAPTSNGLTWSGWV